MREWARMPSHWLVNENSLPLVKMRWSGVEKADQIAALMLYIVFVHHANKYVTIKLPMAGLCALTYTELGDLIGISRTKISAGLKILVEIGVISRFGEGRNNILQIENYANKAGWAKLPAKGLYSVGNEMIHAFHKFKLRSKHELNALKIYLIIVAFRDIKTNYAKISYDRISHYTGVHRNDIKTALSLLVVLGMVHVDSSKSDLNMYATVNMYRLCYLEPYKHRGTTAKEL